jgi:hypothetical protein
MATKNNLVDERIEAAKNYIESIFLHLDKYN